MLHDVIGGLQAYIIFLWGLEFRSWLGARAVSRRARFARDEIIKSLRPRRVARNKSWGLKLKKVHRGKESSKKFEKDFFEKQINNSVFGKTIERMWNW